MVGYMMMCYGTCQLATLLVVEKLHFRLRPMVAILNGKHIHYIVCAKVHVQGIVGLRTGILYDFSSQNIKQLAM